MPLRVPVGPHGHTDVVRVVLNEPIPEEVVDLLTRRVALGHERRDEIWHGEYHMNPVGRPRHGMVQAQVTVILVPLARARGYFPIAEFNLGTIDDFRVPDGGVLRRRPTDLDGAFIDDAVVVVEVLSPGDETWDKLDHYFAHGVEDVIIVDPDAETVRCFSRASGTATGPAAPWFDETGRCGTLDISVEEIADGIDWP